MNPLSLKDIYQKLESSERLLKNYKEDSTRFSNLTVPKILGRDIELLLPKQHPKKKGLSHLIGKQRLLHDLASIEMQAMELGLRTLIEFQNKGDIPKEFLNELAEITLEETEHCRLCLSLLTEIGGSWGMFPTHTGLWNVAKKEDSILERILKVHRYLEGSGLDATFTLANRLKTIPGAEAVHKLILKISTDELKHVKFGSYWFAYFCDKQQVSRISECRRILKKSMYDLPYRREEIKEELRMSAGFLSEEIEAFKDFQKELCI